MSPPRTWTVEEARAALPRVRELLLVLQRAATLAAKVRSNGHARLHGSDPAQSGPAQSGSAQSGSAESGSASPGEPEDDLDESGDGDPSAETIGTGGIGEGASGDPLAETILGAGGIQPILEGLEELGIVLRDPARGLIDFPAIHLGRQVQLCWQLGEDDLGWWHFPDEGFAGRHPLPLPDSW